MLLHNLENRRVFRQALLGVSKLPNVCFPPNNVFKLTVPEQQEDD